MPNRDSKHLSTCPRTGTLSLVPKINHKNKTKEQNKNKQDSFPHSLEPLGDFLRNLSCLPKSLILLSSRYFYTHSMWMWYHQTWHLNKISSWGLYCFLWVNTTIGAINRVSAATRSLCSFALVCLLALLPDGTYIFWSAVCWLSCAWAVLPYIAFIELF